MSTHPFVVSSTRLATQMVLVTLFWCCQEARADEVTVKGTVLTGKVVDVTATGIVFKTDYGSGNLTIPYKVIEALKTDEPLVILHGDEGETAGKLLGVEDDKLVVGDDPATATRIEVSTIIEADTMEEVKSWTERMRNRYRFWTASVDVGFAYKAATTDETDFNFGAQVQYLKRPLRVVAQSSYLFGSEKSQGQSSNTTDNELRGLLKGEYDVIPRLFVYSSHDFEYDEIDMLSLRWVGKIGPGYRVFDNETFVLQVESGFAYNYERFFGGDTEEFPGIAFGAEGSVKLPLGANVTFRGDYLPAIDDWVDDYLIRAEATLSVPLTTSLALKTSVVDTYDETPASGADNNEFKTLINVSWRF